MTTLNKHDDAWKRGGLGSSGWRVRLSLEESLTDSLKSADPLKFVLKSRGSIKRRDLRFANFYREAPPEALIQYHIKRLRGVCCVCGKRSCRSRKHKDRSL